MGIRGAGRAAGRAFIDSNPVTKAISGTLSALGIGHQRNARGESLAALKRAIARGDVAAIQRKAQNSKWEKVRGIAAAALASGTTNYQAAKAAHYAGKGKSWPTSSGPAQGAGSSSGAGSSTPPSTSAPAAPRPKPPCMYGPRGPDGYCPKRPPRSSAPATTGRQTMAGLPTTRPKPPCKYGPRGADGYCPKRPSAGTTRTRRTATDRAVDRAVTAGGTAARNAAASVLKTVGPGNVIRVVAKASLVGLAGLAAYWMTSKLQKLRYKTWDELRYEAANAYRQARAAVAAEAGRGLTPAEGAQLAQYFKARMALLDRAQASGARPSGMVNLTFED